MAERVIAALRGSQTSPDDVGQRELPTPREARAVLKALDLGWI